MGTPAVEGPGIEVPGMGTPAVEGPGIEVPGVGAPGVEGPGVEAPAVAVPGVGAPGVGAPPARPAPSSARARQTQAQLLAAARRVFERDGYLEARVADIVTEAGCSHGTFYTYFRSKNDVFRTVMQGALDNVYASGAGSIEDKTLTQYERIDLANRQFVAVYKDNTALMALFEQAATIDPEIRVLRLLARDRAITRVHKSIERLQREGWARSDIDARTAAASLASMVNFTVYFWLVMGESYDEETLIETLGKLWESSIKRVAG